MIRRFISHLFFVVAMIVLVTSCKGKEIKTPSPGINAVKNGEKFYLNLPENHTEHLVWKLDHEHNRACVEDFDPVWHGDEKGVYYHFKAMSPGTDTLKFVLYKYNEVNKYAVYIVKVE